MNAPPGRSPSPTIPLPLVQRKASCWPDALSPWPTTVDPSAETPNARLSKVLIAYDKIEKQEERKEKRKEEEQSLLDRLDAHPRGHVFDRFLAKTEMQEVWSATDVLISVPTHDGVSEGVLEGMYAGCVPIVSDIPSNRSFLKDGESGVFVRGNPDSADDLAETFGNAVDALPRLKAEMVERNREWVAEQASVEATAVKVVGIIESLKLVQVSR